MSKKEDKVEHIEPEQPKVEVTDEKETYFSAIYKLNHIHCVVRTVVMKGETLVRVDDSKVMPLTHAFAEMKRIISNDYLIAVRS